MVLVEMADDIESDDHVLEAIGVQIEAMVSGLLAGGIKHSVLDEEIDRLGLNFTTKRPTSRSYVRGEAYDAGQAAEALFEPNAALAD